MYLYAVAYFAQIEKHGKVLNGYASGCFLIPYDNQELAERKALETCLEKMPIEDGFYNHDVSCYKIPEIINGLNNMGEVARYKAAMKFKEL